LIIVIFLFVFNTNFSQPLHDANWILGTSFKKGTLIHFYKDSIMMQKVPIILPSQVEIVSISDEKGRLIAYSNGCAVANRKHEIMDSGFKINPGKDNDNYCFEAGYPVIQGMLFLPNPGDTNLYSLFHVPFEINHTLKKTFSYPLYQSTIDKSKNNGDGAVILKNIPILKDTINEGQISAVKHGNGKDWWIIMPRAKSNLYYKLLFTKKGIEKIDTQSIGTIWTINASGETHFSPDGTLFARVNRKYNVNLFDFDRCSGRFSNPRFLEYPKSNAVAAGLAFSPNSRFLYVTNRNELFQFDTQAKDIDSSRILIDTLLPFKNPLETSFYIMQLAPNNKIYIGSTNGVYSFHTIHSPDSLGKKCNFKQNDFQMPEQFYVGLPYMPNYRLGASATPCLIADDDTPSEAPLTVQLYPNPARQQLTVQLFDSSPATIRFYNSVGILIYEKTSAEISSSIEVGAWVSGIYFCKVRQGGKEAIQKVVIQN
jgi:Secretion system C-terminal sorting domain